MTKQRVEIISDRLQKKFSPKKLEVIDDSEKHRGHAGAAGGAGHYIVIIEAECFYNMSSVVAHREIYNALNELIPHEIHALQIKIIRK